MDKQIQARLVLAENPDMVFNEVVRITIERGDLAFWLKFTSEWGGALYFLDEKNTKQREQGAISEEEYEFSRRTYRLGLITLSGLYDKLKVWSEREAGDYAFSMDMLECYFIPAYLQDYSEMNAVAKKQGRQYVQLVLQALENQGKPEEKLESIRQLVHEYIKNMHTYVK
ncbi:hypothetical protein N0M98_11575 [Paenibacillus doosanensis]|uniref:Uncharacterized protein n=1 Tax=Paenibacillus konkukensis TaxID=2020716 RepID=A0ABY4RWN5_9BACL|nr:MULTISPECIES: hypothetical protein [Paenibacillus]MCS7460784.1 hypothetical protein [Paenibacillus doosanensis]UQZ85963.1 hypothetical protein SK3146_05255 [Paenibacillus konkukensis]